jgi:hypothetical protein
MSSIKKIALQHSRNSEDENDITKLLQEFIDHGKSTAGLDISSLSRADIISLHEPIAKIVEKLRIEYGFSTEELFDISEANSEASTQDL